MPTNKQKVLAVLATKSTQWICDACLSASSQVYPVAQVNQLCNKLTITRQIQRQKTECSKCGKPLTCNQILCGRKGKGTGYIYHRGDTLIVPVVQDTDKFWQDIQAAIRAGGNPREIIFLGGGTIPIPDWFRDWCRNQGIGITILVPEEIDIDPLKD